MPDLLQPIIEWARSLTPMQIAALLTFGMMSAAILLGLAADVVYQQSRCP